MESKKSKDIVKDILKDSNMSQNDLAEKLGVKQSNITGLLNRYDTMKVSSLVEMIEAMGYELIVRDTRKDSAGNRKEWRVTDGK